MLYVRPPVLPACTRASASHHVVVPWDSSALLCMQSFYKQPAFYQGGIQHSRGRPFKGLVSLHYVTTGEGSGPYDTL